MPFTTWFAARSRITEDWLEASKAEQYVILGAGLDSFAWRQEGSVRVFELDRPSSQAWKAARIAALGLPIPGERVWVPLDLERQRLGETLLGAGLEHASEVFVRWLGVTPYLTADAIAATLRELPTSSLAVTYVPPETSWDAAARRLGAAFQAQVRELGEPWLSLLTRDQFAAVLAEAGFTLVEDLGAGDVERRYGLPAVHHERIVIARKARWRGRDGEGATTTWRRIEADEFYASIRTGRVKGARIRDPRARGAPLTTPSGTTPALCNPVVTDP